ncbi:MAG: M48 family metalloprotease [Elusimicrobiota bacterium]
MKISVNTVICMGVIVIVSYVPGLPIDIGLSDIASAVSAGSKVTKGNIQITIKEEQEIGRETAASVLGRYELYDDTGTQKYVSLVGYTLTKKIYHSDYDFKFGVLKTDIVNAFACPGGYVFITTGLLKFLQNEAQLAGVLAHEISHITQRHIIKEIEKSYRTSTLIEALQDVSGEKYRALIGETSNLSTMILFRGLNKKDEYEADMLGIKLVHQCGYDANEFVEFLNRLKVESNTAKTGDAAIIRTHPNINARIRKITKRIQKNKYKKGEKNESRYHKNLGF